MHEDENHSREPSRAQIDELPGHNWREKLDSKTSGNTLCWNAHQKPTTVTVAHVLRVRARRRVAQ